MAKKYSDLIELRQQKAAYNIQDEADGDWKSFMANDQFNDVLKKVIASVRNNDSDMHKSFWINGTYGTGKSHAGSVVKHLLCDSVENITDYVSDEYADRKYESLRNDIFSLRKNKRLFPITLYGHCTITHKDDLSLVLQCAITEALEKAGIQLTVKTDFDNYIEHIGNNPEYWELLIKGDSLLRSVAPDTQKLVSLLKNNDMSVIEKIRSALRNVGLHISIGNANIAKWFFEVQNELVQNTDYNGLFVIWDEFTDVMTSPIGLSLLVALQEIDEKIMNSENNSYFFYISHPSALNGLNVQEREKTKGRYHYMNYNMEPVSAFKIMSSKFRYVAGNEAEAQQLVTNYFSDKQKLLDIYSLSSTDPAETRKDLQKLFPLHPSTANLAAYYAREAGSSNRSVFQFIGENDGVRTFLDDENQFMQKNTITPDYLWDYVLDEFNSNITKFGAVTERYNSRKLQVDSNGEKYTIVFKSVLLLNALNNIANNETVTPTIDNIRDMFLGTNIENDLDDILKYFDENSIIQRQPGDVYSIQFSALPPKEIEDIKNQITQNNFKYTSQVISFGDVAKTEFDKKFKQVNRVTSFLIYSTDNNEYTLLNKIENGKKDAKSYATFLALMFAKDATELNELKQIATNACTEERFKNVTFIVFDTFLGKDEYDRFIEYQANAQCAQRHSLPDQQKVHTDSAKGLIKEWIKKLSLSYFTYYLNGYQDTQAVNKMVSTINNVIAPIIFENGAESLDSIKTRSAYTYWAKVSAKQVVDNVLSYNTKTDIITNSGGQTQHVIYLLQDSVEENLDFKADCDAKHPLKLVSDYIDNKLKNIKNETFNLADKLEDLTKPPYGLYQTYANMAMVAFAMRKYINQIFDTNGKPRNQQHLVEDVVKLFKCWEEDGKGKDKLEFRFESKESQKLVKQFVNLFNLSSLKNYSDISSLTDARWAITREFSKEMQFPLWSLKYMAGVKDDIKTLIDNILKVCGAENMREPKLLADTVAGIETYNFELGNLLNNANDEFKTGFCNYLQSISSVGIQSNEFDTAITYLRQNLEGEVGMWTEQEVERVLMTWRISTQQKNQYSVVAFVEPVDGGKVYGAGSFDENTNVSLYAVPENGYVFVSWSDGDVNQQKNFSITQDCSYKAIFQIKPSKPTSQVVSTHKKDDAKAKIKTLSDLNKAKSILEKIIDKIDDSIIDELINEL